MSILTRFFLLLTIIVSLQGCKGFLSGDNETPDNETPLENSAPVADASADQSVRTGRLVTLDGTGSSDANNDQLTYLWTLTNPAGGTATLTGATTTAPTLTPNVDGTYVISLVVNDGALDSVADTVTVTSINNVPLADAGLDQSVRTGALVTLNGNGSSDADFDSLTYLWTLTNPVGGTATLAGATAVAPTFVPNVDGAYVISLVVNDGDLDSVADTVTVTAVPNNVPLADAGTAQAAAIGVLVTLDGSGSSDADGDSLSYLWTLTDVPATSIAALDDTTVIDPTFTPDLEGTYTLTLEVNDGLASSIVDTVIVTAEAVNTAPVAIAGSNVNVTTGATVTLSGAGSFDNDVGDTLTYVWALDTRPGWSTTTLSDATTATPSFIADMDGAYELSLVVTDDGGLNSAPDTITVTAAPAPSLSGVVLYIADQDVGNEVNLYAGTLDGDPTIKLNGALVVGGDISSWKKTSDGATVVFSGDQDTDALRQLYSVPIGGGTVVRISGDLKHVSGFSISPDDSMVVYTADQGFGTPDELYSVPIDGSSAPTLLDSPDIVDGNVYSSFHITPDSTTVVYVGDLQINNKAEVYAVPINGSSAPIKISGAFGSVQPGYFEIDPTGTYVVYMADPHDPNRDELFSAGIDGSGAVQLNSPLPLTAMTVRSIGMSSDGSTMVYGSDAVIYQEFDVFSVPIGGGNPVQLSGNFGIYDDGTAPAITPDSSTVVYLYDTDSRSGVPPGPHFYSVPIGGGTPVKLHDAMDATARISKYDISPDGNTVVFIGDLDTDGVKELYSMPIGGGAITRLNDTIPLNSTGFNVVGTISDDSTTLVFLGFLDSATTLELYAVPIGGGTTIKLNDAIVAGGRVNKYYFADDGTTVLYEADQEVDNQVGLYAVPMTGGTPVKVNGTGGSIGGST